MSVKYNLVKSNMRGKSQGRYYAKAVSTGEIDTDELAVKLSKSGSMSVGTVKGVIADLVLEMKDQLASGKTVELDNFGRFKLSIESLSVEKPEDFNTRDHIIGAHCSFVEEGKRRQVNTQHLEKVFSEGLKFEKM